MSGITRRKGAALVATASVLAIAQPAHAATAASSKAIIDIACGGLPEGTKIKQGDLAYALLVASNVNLMREEPVRGEDADTYRSRLVARIASSGDSEILLSVQNLEAKLRGAQSAEKPVLRYTGTIPAKSGTVWPHFLFQPGAADLVCNAKPDDLNGIDDLETTKAPRFAVRAKPEDLPLSGKERRGADAFAFGFERTRSRLDDGTLKTDTTVTLGGVAGVRLTGDKSASSVYLYGQYNLSRARTNPAPTLAPGASESDGDTNTLGIGLTIKTKMVNTPSFDLYVSGSASTMFDLVHKTDRVQGDLVFTPTIPNLGPKACLNQFSVLGKLRFRCGFSVEVLGAAVIKRGTTTPADYDSFLTAGPRASLELLIPNDDNDGAFVKVTGRNLWVLTGTAKTIRRLDASLGYRFWTAQDVGIDVSFKYQIGSNASSFEREDILSFGIGVIY